MFQVIICTDGLANVGIGSLDGTLSIHICTNSTFYMQLHKSDEAELKMAKDFYKMLGELALKKGYMFFSVSTSHNSLVNVFTYHL